MKRGEQTLFCWILAVALTLSACAGMSENPPETAESAPRPVTKLDAEDAGTKTIRLGSSLYAVRVAREFSHLRVSNEDWEDDMVARYHNENTLLDFSVYQFSKEDYPDTLEEFVEEEAKEYGAWEIVTGKSVNGIAVGYYRAIDDYEGVFREGVTYALDNGDEYIEIDFWFVGYLAESEMREIIASLTLIESEPLALGSYRIQIPQDFRLISDESANPVVYASGSDSLRLYVSRFFDKAMSLPDFARAEALQKGGTDIETDAEINGVPVAFYRSIEALDGAFHSTLTCVIGDGDGFTELMFCLDGITAESEADALLNTLSMQP